MTALIVLTALAIIIAVIVALCAAGTIPRNAGIGIRIPSTRHSEDAWKAGHQAAYAPALVGAALTILFAGVGMTAAGFVFPATVIATVLLVCSLAWATVRAHRAAASTPER